MSNKILDRAWDADLPLSRKMVLIALADQANDRGESYPGLESLKRRCSMGMRTVYEALRELEDQGYISRSQLPGYQTLYQIHLDKLLQRDLLAPAKSAGVRHPQGCGERSPAPSRKTTPAAAAPIEATLTQATGSVSEAPTRAVIVSPTAAGMACRAMREAGCVHTNPADPNLLAALAEGLTGEVLAHYVRAAIQDRIRKPFAYAISAARGAYAKGATPINGSRNDRSSQPRESTTERARRLAREAEERDAGRAAFEHGDSNLVGSHG